MARATRLRIYSEGAEEGDDASVAERFPVAPPPVQPNSQLAEDVLRLLRADTQTAMRQADHADATASTALYQAQQANTTVAEIATAAEQLKARTDQVEASAREIGTAAMKAVETATAQQAHARQAAATVFATVLQHMLVLLAHLVTFLLERSLALLALGATVWLWHSVLEDPTVMRLIALGLGGLLVIAPALWLSARGKGGGNAQ
jgi:hypothetical protein